MRICNLSSGSEGNCTLIQTDTTSLLIDAGISSSLIVDRLNHLGVKPSEIDAILISHEHYDHTKGINVFAAKYKTKIYAHPTTMGIMNDRLTRVEQKQKHLFYDSAFQIGDLSVETVELSHDANYTCGFKIGQNGKYVGIITDLGEVTTSVLNFLTNLSLCYIEANHDPNLLMQNPHYSYQLKKRILSKFGHLSNQQSADVIEHMSICGTKQFVLSHLSKENNTPELAYTQIKNLLAQKDIVEGVHIKIDVATTQTGTIFRL